MSYVKIESAIYENSRHETVVSCLKMASEMLWETGSSSIDIVTENYSTSALTKVARVFVSDSGDLSLELSC